MYRSRSIFIILLLIACFSVSCNPVTSTEPSTDDYVKVIIDFNTFVDGTPITSDILLEGDGYSTAGISLAGHPGPDEFRDPPYCHDANAVAIHQARPSIGANYLSAARPGEIDSCNTIPIEINFFRSPVRQVTITFFGSDNSYTLQAYNLDGDLLGEVQEEAIFEGGTFTITYTSDSFNISRVTFGDMPVRPEPAGTYITQIEFHRSLIREDEMYGISFDTFVDETPITSDILLEGNEYSSAGILLAGYPGPDEFRDPPYCQDANVVAIHQALPSIGVNSLSAARPGEIDLCNTIPIEITFFEMPVLQVTITFFGSDNTYTMQAYNLEGDLLGEVQEESVFQSGTFTITYTSDSYNISRIIFGKIPVRPEPAGTFITKIQYYYLFN